MHIQDIFINNKQSRAATLEHKFTDTTLSSCSSFDDYCQTLKDIAGQLADVDQPVTESRLVIQMVRGLPIEFDTIGAIINQSCPSWDDARGMVEAEQQRQAARTSTNRDTVLLHSQATSGTNRTTVNNQTSLSLDSARSAYPNGYRGNNYDPNRAARGGGQYGRGGRYRGRGGRSVGYRNFTAWGPQPNNHQNVGFPHLQHVRPQQWVPPPTPLSITTSPHSVSGSSHSSGPIFWFSKLRPNWIQWS